MADTKISALPSASTPLAGTEVLPIVQSGATKKVASDNLTVKNIRSTATTGILQVSGPSAGATRVMTVPDANFTAARTDSSNTFSGTQTVTGNVVAQGYGNVYYKIQSLDSSAYRMAIKLSADDESLVITSCNDYKVLTTTGYSTPDTTRLYASNAEQLRITSSATTVLNGNLVIGTSGKGIDFSAASHAAGMTSELLNDYEEGTWTPTDWSGAGLSISSSGARYTKIGRLVHVQAFIGYPATASGAAAGITGLPFASGANIPIKALPSNGVVLGGYIGSGNSGIEFKLSNNYTTSVANASLSSAGIMLDVTYSI